MATLLLCLAGPMQSWGTTSRFDERDTQLEPSKSGVLGLVCAALGRDRAEPVDDLAALRMGVRVDREGIPMQDYHTARGAVNAKGEKSKHPIVSKRYYLSDAVFLVGLDGNYNLLTRIHDALRAPYWPLCLGRKSFVPSLPVYLPDGVVDADLITALQEAPSLVEAENTNEFQSVAVTQRVVLEDDTEGAMRFDEPVAPFAERRFGPRFVKTIDLAMGGSDAPRPIDT
ncbi:type I-E CRISPR-associated protein Cas5/CasD [Salinisphaera orenii]|uniref:type I-E CRISPR-associated protein Cas5/CasD n=1 Tax=Salinisphaera orenii TaxID=856731 RepID=UPI000DBE286C